MNKKYAIGSALLLIGVAATGFLIDEHARAAGQAAVAPSTVNPNGVLGTASDNSAGTVLSPDGYQGINNTGDGSRYHLVTNHNGALDQIPEMNETPVPAQNDNEAVALNNADAVVAAAPKIYYNRSIDNSTDNSEKKHHHFRFRLPENTGIEMGFNQSGVTSGQNNSMPAGNFNFGLVYNMNMGDHMAFQPGIRYLTVGSRLQNELEIDNKEKLTMHNIEVPANLIWKPGKLGNARIMIGAGPYVSYLVGAKDKYQATPYTDDGDYIPSTQQYNTANINKLNWGLGGFVGIQSPDGFYVKAGGEYSMMNLMKNNTADNISTYSVMVNVGDRKSVV